MVSSCKNYISNNGTSNIWDQERDEVIIKIRACIDLNNVCKVLLTVLHKTFKKKTYAVRSYQLFISRYK